MSKAALTERLADLQSWRHDLDGLILGVRDFLRTHDFLTPSMESCLNAAGTRVSTDGGRTWLPLDGPPLVVVSWDAESGLWGANATGELWKREGQTWLAVGQIPGEPEALLATADILYAAAQDASGVTAIYQSGDGGRTWTIRYRDPDR